MSDYTVIADYPRGAFYTIGYAARFCRHKTQSIANLHLKGVIPEPRFRDKGQNRLYTLPQLECLVIAFRECGHYARLDKLRAYIAEHWPDSKELPDGVIVQISENNGS